MTLREIERRAILACLLKNDYNRTKTCGELDISIRKLRYKIAEYRKQGFIVPDNC